MSLIEDLEVRVDWVPFWKTTAHCLERHARDLVNTLAVQIDDFPVEKMRSCRRVHRKRASLFLINIDHSSIHLSEISHVFRVHQIQTSTKVNRRLDDGRRAAIASVCAQCLRPIQGAAWRILPKVKAVAAPVVSFGRVAKGFGRENRFRRCSCAAMKAYDFRWSMRSMVVWEGIARYDRRFILFGRKHDLLIPHATKKYTKLYRALNV